MAYTSASSTEIARNYSRSATWILELKTGHSASNTWVEFPYIGSQPTVTITRGQPSTCEFELPWSSAYLDEADTSNRVQLRADVRVTQYIRTDSGVESEVKFLGYIIGKTPSTNTENKSIKINCADRSIRINEARCSVQLTPTELEVIASGDREALELIGGGIYGRVYGLKIADVPNAFNDAGTARRSWVPGSTTIWSHPTSTDSIYMVPLDGEHSKINYESGAVSILEPKHTITNFPSSTTLRIPGDHTRFFKNGVKFDIYGSTDNDGAYTLSSDSSYSGGYTTLTVSGAGWDTTPASVGTVLRNYFFLQDLRVYLETGGESGAGANCDIANLFKDALEWPTGEDSLGLGLTSSDYDIPDTGIDIGMAYAFDGRVKDLFDEIARNFQANLQYWFDSASGKHKVRVVTQDSTADWTMANATVLQMQREQSDRDLCTAVEIRGRTEMPENALQDAVITDWTTGSGLVWFAFDGNTVGADSDFASTYPNMINGNDALSANVYQLPSTADLNGVSGNRYAGWYQFIKADFGSVRENCNYVRYVAPRTRNANAAAGDQRDSTTNSGFWPGVWIQVSEDNTNWFTLAPALYGNFPPGHVVELDRTQIVRPRFRYLRIYCMAYEHGRLLAYPSIGVGELSIHFDYEYRVVKSVSGTSGAEYFYTSDLAQAAPVSRYYPDLLARFGGGHKVHMEDIGNRYNEFLAHDYGLNLFEEKLRLYLSPSRTGTCDPRVKLWDTVEMLDNWGGTISTALVEKIVHQGLTTTVTATDYRAGVWGE